MIPSPLQNFTRNEKLLTPGLEKILYILGIDVTIADNGLPGGGVLRRKSMF